MPSISWSSNPIVGVVDCIVQDVKVHAKYPSLGLRSRIPTPKRLPRLPVLPGLCLFASPLALDFFQLLISLLLDFRRGAAQADEELRALELFRQSHACPHLGVFGSELPDLIHLGGREVVFLFAEAGAEDTGSAAGRCERG